MPFATPWFLLGFSSLAALAALYLRRRREVRRDVPSLLLWRRALAPPRDSSRRGVPRLPWIFFLELLILSALVAAAATPLLRLRAAPPLVVVLDPSASMTALSPDGSSPQSRAAEALGREMRSGGYRTARIIAAAPDGPVPLGAFGPDDATRAIRSAVCDAPAADMASALSRALELAGKDGAVLVLSDAAPAVEPVPPVKWRAFGEALPNAGIAFAELSAMRDGGLLLSADFRAAPSAHLEISAAPLAETGSAAAPAIRAGTTADSRGRAHLSLDVPDCKALRVSIAGGGALAIDDSALLFPSGGRRVSVAISISDPQLRRLAERAARSAGAAADVSGFDLLAPRPDVLICEADSVSPSSVFPARRGLVFHPGTETNVVAGPVLVDSSSPVLEGVSLDGMVWNPSVQPPPGRPIARVGHSPRTIFTADGARIIRAAFSDTRLPFFSSAAWPVLVDNLVSEAALDLPGTVSANLRVAAPATFTVPGGVREGRITPVSGSGESYTLRFRAGRALWTPPRAGRYRFAAGDFSQDLSANFFSADESDLSGRSTGTFGAFHDSFDRVRRGELRDIAALFAAAALLLVALHFVATRRMRISTRISAALAALAAILALAAIFKPSFKRPEKAGTLVVVADRSSSIPADELLRQQAILGAISAARSGGEMLAAVSFGATAAIEQPPAPESFRGFTRTIEPDGSDLSGAISAALSLIPPGTPGRILLLSDGLATGEDPLRAAAHAAARGIAIDHRSQSRPPGDDIAIVGLDAPIELRENGALLATAWIASPVETDAAYYFERNGAPLSKGRIRLPAGLSSLSVRDVEVPPGASRYRLAVSAQGVSDNVPENNVADFIVRSGSERPLLVFPASPDSRLPEMLSAGATVRVAKPAIDALDLAVLGGVSGVVIENTRADAFGQAALRGLDSWVREAGGGLLVTGGRNSFGPGGYFESPVDGLLPVSMERRDQRLKTSSALAIALDRSGSMMVHTQDGRTKMELADIGTMTAIDLLSSIDYAAVIAVDTAPQVVVPLSPASQAQASRQLILGIQSMGGGIYVEEALKALYRELSASDAKVRHAILFADAADSEVPGEYKKLIAAALGSGITLSVVGLGTPADSDAALLREIAELGGGECHFTADATELPRLFALDTFTYARETFSTNPVPVRFTVASHLVSDALPPPSAAPAVGGYNLVWEREGATVIASAEAAEDPVIAAMRPAGSGRALVFAGEADGSFSGPFGTWELASEFWAGMARATAGPIRGERDGVLLSLAPSAGALRLTAYLDPKRADLRATASIPFIAVRQKPGLPPSTEWGEMLWDGPETLSATLPLKGGETVLASVEMPDGSRENLPPYTLPHPAEFDMPADPGAGEALLSEISQVTGGGVAADPASEWGRMPKSTRAVALSPWLLIAAALLFLAAVAERRLGRIASGVAAREKTARREKRGKKRRAAKPRPDPQPSGEPAQSERKPDAPPEPPSPFTEAKRRAARR